MMPLLNSRNQAVIITLLLLSLIFLPASAANIAIYGDTAGFNPALHMDEFSVAVTLDGSSGTGLDTEINQFADPSIDVMFLGGDDSFSTDTAARIEQSVSSGKILVVTNKHYRKFDSLLPALNNDTVPEGEYLLVTGEPAQLSSKIFRGLRTQYPVTNPLSNRLNTIAKPGSAVLLSYDTGDPALLYAPYGSGYVVEWAMTSPTSYLNSTEADFINVRLIRYLLSLPAQPVEIPSTVPPLTPPMTTVPAPVETATDNEGSLLVYSSPTSANILLDGIYHGTTPGNLTGITPGNHILRLTMSGYYDYEGTVYIIAGQPNHAFGTLQPINHISESVTPVPTTAPAAVTSTTEQSKGIFDNPSVIVALIGVITASIAAGATIFTHYTKIRKEGGKE